MNVKFTASEKKTGNKGSVRTLVEYLEKENKGKELLDHEMFFDHTHNHVSMYDVIDQIDGNKRKLGAKDAKFYMLVISPSEKELAFINNDIDKLKTYTRELMNAYAENFNKDGLLGENILYFAKVEKERYDKRHNKIKNGVNTHIHVIISRRDKDQKYKLSPVTNHINSTKGIIKGGFSRISFYEKSEQVFDKLIQYPREFKDSWEYQYTMKHGSQDKISEMLRSRQIEDPIKIKEINSDVDIKSTPQKESKSKGFEM